MKRITTLVFVCSSALSAVTVWFSIALCRTMPLEEISNFQIVDLEVRAASWVILSVVSLFLMSESIRRIRVMYGTEQETDDGLLCRKLIAWTTGLLAINTAGLHTSSSRVPQSHGVAADTALSPIAASAVLSHIIRRRREQMKSRTSPGVLTLSELDALGRIRERAAQCDEHIEQNEIFESTPDVQTVLTAVDRVVAINTRPASIDVDSQWLIEVKLFGYPMAVAVDGTVVEFRKKRSLELLTWLALNRDRSRRSTARTAMWDIDVSDSSFSTVVSDLRRGLRDAVGHEECHFIPTTYSDELPLSDLVVTDADRLVMEYRRFRETQMMSSELRELLTGMRDIPLAGTTYSWADLDGTTTRLVMSALTVTVDVAEVSLEHDALEDAILAVTAGLRVFPGCDELLAIQQACLHKVAHTSSQTLI